MFVRWGKPGKKPKNKRTRRVPLFGLALAAAKAWVTGLPAYCRCNPLGLAFPTARGCRRRDNKPPRGWKHLHSASPASPPSPASGIG